MSPRLNRRPLLLVLALVTLVFARALGQGFVWDDGPALIYNPLFNPPTLATLKFYWTHAAWNLYQPLTCTLWAACAWVGYVPTPDASGVHLSPLPFHLLNIGLHLLTTAGVYRVLQTLKIQPVAAAFGAALFALHPVQVESIAFAGQLNTPLYGCLAIFALDDFLSGAPGEVRLVRGTLLFVLAALAQPVAIVIAPIGVMLDWLLGRRTVRHSLRRAAPWLVIATAFAVWTRLHQHGSVAAAQGPLWSRPLIALDNLAVQTAHVVWPLGLTVDYGRTPRRLLAHPTLLLSGLFTLAVIAWAWAVRARRPLTAGGLVWAGLALLPSSGIIPFDFEQFSSVADRHVYFAMMGFALVALDSLFRWPTRVAWVSGATVSVVLAGVTVRQIGFWKNNETLFAHGTELNPSSWLCHQNLGSALMVSDPRTAMREFKAAVSLNPSELASYDFYAMAAMNAGDAPAAEQMLHAALQRFPESATLRQRLKQVHANTASPPP